MMNDKSQLIAQLREEFDRWEKLLSGLSEAQIIKPLLDNQMSIKDEVAHLRAWQQISIARLEAALHNTAPTFPGWPATFDLKSESDLDEINAWIDDTYRDQPWSQVYQDWRAGFLRCLELAESISETDLLEENKYAWIDGYPLAAVLAGSYEHHDEHLEPLLAWHRGQSNAE